MSRRSLSLRRLGRTFREFDLGILRAVESLLVRNCPCEVKMPLLAVCGPPRSGHTLTYQVITQGVGVFVVDNLQYFFYRTPLIGCLLSKLFCRPYVSDFKSRGGYIEGLNGPQQGVFIWNYWCDMYEEERRPRPDPIHLRNFGRLLNKLYTLDRRPFCSSWLGHALYFEQLKEIFGRHIIIRTRRDLISNAMSIAKYACRPSDDTYFQWQSTRPRECQDGLVMSSLSGLERIAWQVYFINRRMDEQVATGQYAVFDSQYADLCKDPRGVVSRLIEFAKTKDIVLERRPGNVLPKRFNATKLYRDQNEQTKTLARAFDALVEKYGPVSVPLESV